MHERCGYSAGAACAGQWQVRAWGERGGEVWGRRRSAANAHKTGIGNAAARQRLRGQKLQVRVRLRRALCVCMCILERSSVVCACVCVCGGKQLGYRLAPVPGRAGHECLLQGLDKLWCCVGVRNMKRKTKVGVCGGGGRDDVVCVRGADNTKQEQQRPFFVCVGRGVATKTEGHRQRGGHSAQQKQREVGGAAGARARARARIEIKNLASAPRGERERAKRHKSAGAPCDLCLFWSWGELRRT